MAQASDVESPPAPSPRGPLGGLFFRGPEDSTTAAGPLPQPRPETITGEEPPATTDPWPLPLDADGSVSGPSWTPGASGDEDESGTTSSDTSAAGRRVKLGKAAARATGAKAVLIAGGIANRLAATTEGQRAAQLYLTDDEDAANIGHPLADIVSRHGGVAGKELSPDANDALAAIMGLTNYATKQFARFMAAAEYDRQVAGGAVVDPQA